MLLQFKLERKKNKAASLPSEYGVGAVNQQNMFQREFKELRNTVKGRGARQAPLSSIPRSITATELRHVFFFF